MAIQAFRHCGQVERGAALYFLQYLANRGQERLPDNVVLFCRDADGVRESAGAGSQPGGIRTELREAMYPGEQRLPAGFARAKQRKPSDCERSDQGMPAQPERLPDNLPGKVA